MAKRSRAASERPRRNRDIQGVFAGETFEGMAQRMRPFVTWVHENQPFVVGPSPLISDRDIERVSQRALRRLPSYLRRAKRRQPTAAEMDDLRRTLPDFLDRAFRRPSLDADLILRSTEFAAIRATALGNNFFFTRQGHVEGAVFDIDDGTTKEKEHKSALSGLALAIDLTLEVLGLILGIIGIAAPKFEPSLLEGAFKRMADESWFKAALRKLIEGLRQKDPGAMLEFLDALEQSGNLGEILGHMFAHMSGWDYFITTLKIIAWIVAAVGSAGAAMAAKLVSIGLDIVGLILKLPELDAI
jgi:hypothetical protein